MSNVQFVEIDGALHIGGLDAKNPTLCFPLSAMPRLIDEGRLDALDAQLAVKLVVEYITTLREEDARESLAVIRYFLAMRVLDYAKELHGGAVWQHKGVTMPLDAHLIRTALEHQIEGILASYKQDAKTTDRIFTFYMHMQDWQSPVCELSDMGKETVQDMFNCIIDGFIANGYQLPTVH